MELQELKALAELNELDLLYKIIEIAESNKADAERVLKGEVAAAKRVRSSMQDLRTICEIIRDNIQIRRGIKWENRKLSALDKVIKAAENSEKKDIELIAKRKKERLARLGR